MKKRALLFLIALIISPVGFSKSSDQNNIPLALSYTPNGLTFSALDGDFNTTLSGYIQADAMNFAQNNHGLSSGANLRRARLYLNGNLTSAWSYNLGYDFRSQNILLAAINYAGWNNMQLSLGQIFPNFSLNNTSSVSALDTLEPPLPVDAFSPPYYYVGAGYNIWNDFLTLQLAAFGPSSSETVTGRNPLGGTARLVYSPIHTETRMLDFGLSGWIQRPDGSNSISLNTVPEIQSFNSESMVNTGTIYHVTHYGVAGVEMAAIYGPWSVQTEYLQMQVNRDESNPNLKFLGGYLTGSYFITGESLAYAFPDADFEGNIKIHHEKIGAWEVLARYSTIDLNDEDVSGGKEQNMTLGLNWYLNQHIKFLLNYVYAMAKPGSNEKNDNVNSIAARMQVAF